MADSIFNKAKALLNKTLADLEKVPFLKDLEKKTSIKIPMLVAGTVVFLALFMYLAFGPGFLTNMVGFLYPVYASIKAIESEIKADDTRWLIYWVIYAGFTLVEPFTDTIIYWIPFYYAFKLGFLVWLMLPNHNGAETIYLKVIKPFVKKHEAFFAESNEANAAASPSKSD